VVTATSLPLFLPWLAQYGQQLLGLQLSSKDQPGPGRNGPLLQLSLARLPNLQQLSLEGVGLLLLQSSPSDTGGSCHGSKATAAVLGSSSSGNSGSSTTGAAGDVGELQQQAAGLRDLQELRLQGCRLPNPDILTQLAAAATGLTSLNVSCVS
jgi:hypothetical protein